MKTPSSGRITTVLGEIEVVEAGHVQPHEHVLSDMSAIVHSHAVGPAAPAVAAADDSQAKLPAELSATARDLARLPVTLENYDAIRHEVLNVDNLRLCSEADAVAELHKYRAFGGGTIVDSSSRGMGRDALGLARVSRATGVHIVMGSGYYTRDYHPAGLDHLKPADIAEEITRDVERGVGDTGVRAGLIGEIGLSWPVHPTESRVLEGACEAQQVTGTVLQLHPGRHPEAPGEAITAVEKFGGDPARTIVSHLDRTLWDPSAMLELASTGCYLEFDLFGQESSYYAFNPDARRPNDRTRVEWLMELIDHGHRHQLLVSQDICQKVYLSKFGGPGYVHILQNVLPLMRRMGMTEADITAVTRTNPGAALARKEFDQ